MRKRVNQNQRKYQQTLLRSLKKSIDEIITKNKKWLIEDVDKNIYFGDHRLSHIGDNYFKLYTYDNVYTFYGIDSVILYSFYKQTKNYKKINEIIHHIKNLENRKLEIEHYKVLMNKKDYNATIIDKLDEARYRYNQSRSILRKKANSIINRT